MDQTDAAKVLKDVSSELLTCMQCGTCSGSCPSGRYTSMVTRKIVRMARVNKKILHDKNLWMCTTCYTCQERCPRQIKITDAILAIRTITVHNGCILPEHRKVSQLVLQYGHAVPINDTVKQKRKKLGIEALPETVHKYPDALLDVQTILKSCKFDELVAERPERQSL
ncbi:CoB--CoM heterodisulfide reductase subunit C [Methanosarcinales archaeon]|nr:MAG: CoB--CoM heterodisulfide reductase subunit C [Methanosarcinales archaeon]